MSQSEGEKSFAPSAKRKRDAAQKGDVIRSRELATAGAVAVGAVWLKLAGPWLLESLADVLRKGLRFDRAAIDDFTPGARLASALLEGLPPVVVLGLAVLLVSLVSQLGFGEGRWIPANLAPKASRIDPAKGLKRMFGPNGLIEMAKGIAKVALLGTIAWIWARDRIETLSRLGRGDLFSELRYAWDQLIALLFWLAAGLALIALLDLPVQLVRRLLRLRMTLQDVRDEQKDAEGAPEKKAAIKERQRKIAMGALIPAMQEASFVLTNPTHFAVALSWDPEKAPAPVVVAKGRGEKAMAIRELAAEYEVPVLAYPALARSVYYSTREKRMIREEHYVAVAAILAFVLGIQRGETRKRPEVSVPVTLRFDADGRLESASK
ncbi:EscU/YscU/HrcU family type III secretion system export apparatus switch protein [Novosphingobium profundi]|uniref:EscU/YscU/HrcU family type III secretion system export apparatus switch protein n=1 Tax=Novosphingobium profundi TaxID=1774954 RepID=UPI001BD97BC3|nr:EscU/YscU/HrcU family type III secretion system export apparatus switch protein [Novosphingobium profundi]MBT0670437.1 EscU/YscU/HrcU family type III secretion system export apparatus switch protein [Novosphingobium profundi]